MKFRISSALKDIVGKDLITNDFIAIYELVKNSYDAHARNVTITFEPDKLIIADNGKGMSLDDLEKKWLFLGFSGKRDGTEDSEDDKKKSYRDSILTRKHFAGAKGIGRFSSDRLGNKLTLQTSRYGLAKIEEIIVDWTHFEKDQKEEFDTIEVEHRSFVNAENLFPEESSSGTIIAIEGLHSGWKRKKLVKLKHSLEKLINPFSKTNDFEINIICKAEFLKDNASNKDGSSYLERDKVNGPVKNAILDILDIKTSHINLIIKDGYIQTRIVDRTELIYHIKEKASRYEYLVNLEIDLFFLNRAAKLNFTNKMGLQPINFGSIFLFKNGFRVMPYGETGDDSWQIDFRGQQGYNRTLGTRDLFGRVEVLSDNVRQFKEVSSRDGGLVKTDGYSELMDAFELAHRRLERYVVGVLWGEAFKRKNYFGVDMRATEEANRHRKALSHDKDSENIVIAKSNLGSKIDFIQLIKSLSANKKIEIIDYNKDFISLVNEKLEESQFKFITDLSDIATQTDDVFLAEKVQEIEKRYLELQIAKEAAEERARKERLKREVAEKEAHKEKRKREEAEVREAEERRKKEKAKLVILQKENQRKTAEIARLKAERSAHVAFVARGKAEAKAREEESRANQATEAKNALEKETLYLNSALSRDDYVIESHHLISQEIDIVVGYADRILKKMRKDKLSEKYTSILSKLIRSAQKTSVLAKFAIHANFNASADSLKGDMNNYIKQYISNVLGNVAPPIENAKYKNIPIKFTSGVVDGFTKTFTPIKLMIIFDNLISNASKHGSSEIHIATEVDEEGFIVFFVNDGEEINKMDKEHLFDQGFSTTDGSGLGLFHVEKMMKEMNGCIHIDHMYSNGVKFVMRFKNEDRISNFLD